jgi:hypothetical protein
MKANLLILLLTIVIVTTACRIKSTEMLTLDNPSITIKDINVITSDSCKVFCYTINLYSPSRLCEFVAIPHVTEKDTITKIEFSDHTRRATVTYYYVVPRGVDCEDADIEFFLNDNEEHDNVAELSHRL